MSCFVPFSPRLPLISVHRQMSSGVLIKLSLSSLSDVLLLIIAARRIMIGEEN